MAHKPKKAGSKPLSSEDKSLWAHVSKNVEPQLSNRFTGFEDLINPQEEAVPKPRFQVSVQKKIRAFPPVLPMPSKDIFEENTYFRESVLPSVRKNVPGLDRNTSEKLRRGRMVIEGRVDLHGLTQKEAHPKLRSFLGSAHRNGKRCVLVITGKGSSIEKTDDAPFMAGGRKGVLREEVPKWLAAPDLRRLVLDYRMAQPKHGGEGALYILLRRAR
ncbi:MAG: Smr/MutS family protein [Sneathiella sp.]|nr:Smr/MutS family protein [Sneathiella sp.]